ncbi:SAM-dependent methyltransferase [Candidatus Woesebacteria bacterium]|nr:SAM-dependent methyltransferase [Candidatus Woesebacteria bacterium]
MSLIVFLVLVILVPVVYVIWATNTKDAPWVPMEADVVDRVMKIANIGPNDIFYDLGSGDGRLVIAATMRGATAYGVELDRWRAMYSKIWIKVLGLENKAKIINKNLFDVDLSKATIVDTFLLSKTHEALKRKILKVCKVDTKIVAVMFEYKNWKVNKLDNRSPNNPIYLYEIGS